MTMNIRLDDASAEGELDRTDDVDLTFKKDEAGRVTHAVLEKPWLKLECRRRP